MKAAQIKDYGSADKVQVTDIEQPTPNDDQVLVEVHASSLNPFDTMVREGYLKEMIPLELPVTLGGDIAGVVSETGKNVTNVSVGDKVYGQSAAVAGNSGALAEFAVTKYGQVGIMPSNLDFNQSASLALVGVSAQQAIKEHVKLTSEQKILIHGGSGGIGSIAIQIAKDIGAFVATTATGDGVELAKSLGADQVIDYANEKFDEVLSDFDAVFDTVAGETYDRSFKVVKRGGIIVSMNAQPNQELMDQYGVEAIYQSTRVTTEALNGLRELIESGVVTARVGKVLPLDQVQQAFEARENGKVSGKIVVSVK